MSKAELNSIAIFNSVLERIEASSLIQDPFPHLLIQDLLPEKDYESILCDIPRVEDFSRVIYPGVGSDRGVAGGTDYGLALNNLSQHPQLAELTEFLKSKEFSAVLLSKFSAPDSWIGVGSAIPTEKHAYFNGKSKNYTSVLDVHKDLPGYAISPHRDVDSKIITFLYYLEPDDAVANWGTLLCRPKPGLSLDDVERAPPVPGHPKWRDWSMFDVVKIARATPNTLLVFAPNAASYHAVNMDIPIGHTRRERTVIRGFIRSGSDKKNFINSFGGEDKKNTIQASVRRKFGKIVRKFVGVLEDKEIVAERYDAVVVSYGGAGTTMLLDFLSPHLRVNSRNSFVDGIKHVNSPEHPVLRRKHVERAIYLVADPREAVISLFRRNYALRMMAKLQALHGNADEYRRFVDDYESEVENLSDFLRYGEDLFGFKKHWQQWHEDAVSFPVLFVRYDSLHDSVAEILQFLELPASLECDFPPKKARATCLSQLSVEDRQQLDKIYFDLASDVAKGPDLAVRHKTC